MSEHERQTNFVSQIIAYDETSERQILEDRMSRTRSDEGCVRRAACLMLLFAGLAIAGLIYAIVFAADFPLDLTQLLTHLTIKALAVVALGSLFCAVAFIALGLLYRREFNRHREECRRLGMKLLESRLGKPGTPASNGARGVRTASLSSQL
jgi:hypothetical protein